MSRDQPPAPGAIVYDEATDELAEVVSADRRWATLQPPGGGERWEADVRDIRAADRGEALRAKLRARNAASRRDREARP